MFYYYSMLNKKQKSYRLQSLQMTTVLSWNDNIETKFARRFHP